jgi:hypothetical protein
VEIDGVARGQAPPLAPVALAPGTHRVVLRRHGDARWSSEVQIESGKTAELNVRVP